MKKILFAFVLLAGIVKAQQLDSSMYYSQNLSGFQYTCGFDKFYHSRYATDLTFRNAANAYENSLVYKTGNPPTVFAAPYVIPVVFHVITDGSVAQNISYQQIQWQLNALNAAFANSYQNYNGQINGQFAVNTQISFCLAVNPQGPATWTNPGENGVMRYDTSDVNVLNHVRSIGGMNTLMSITHPTAAFFDFDNYLNIWLVPNICDSGVVCSQTPSVIGYATFPGMGLPLDGIVMRLDCIGDQTLPTGGNMFASLSEGKILAHEAGHYLGLLHTFETAVNSQLTTNPPGCFGLNGTDCANDGDYICDTPPTSIANNQCGSTQNTCNDALPAYGAVDQNDMLENFMCYSDDACMNTFTNDQRDRMWGALDVSMGAGLRSNLVSAANLAFTGCSGPNGCAQQILSSVFNYSMGAGSSCTNITVNFIAPSGPGLGAISWDWDFGDGNIGNTPVISHTYAAAGTYTVTLVVTDANGATETSTEVLNLNINAQITGQSATVVCEGSMQTIDITFTGGTAPFTATITDGVTSYTVDASQPHAVLTVPINANSTFTLIPPMCNGVSTGSASFTVVQCCPSIITNGDFEQGNTGFVSDLDFCQTTCQSSYCIDNTSSPIQIANKPHNLNLPNRGMNLEIDGPCDNNCQLFCPVNPALTPMPGVPNQGLINSILTFDLWRQDLATILPNTTYEIGFLSAGQNSVTTLHRVKYQIQVRDLNNNNTPLFTSGILSPPQTTNPQALFSPFMDWIAYSVLWSSPANVSSNVQVVIMQVEDFWGNDFDYVIDDVRMQPLGTINAGPDTLTICTNASAQLGLFPNCGDGTGFTYLWQPATGLSATNVPNPVASPTVTTTYTVIANGPNGSGGIDSITVVVNPVVASPVTVTPAFDTICLGDSLTLIASMPGGASYYWNGTSDSTNTLTATPSATTIYTVTATDSSGCVSVGTSTITITTFTVGITSNTGSNSLCVEGGIDLTATTNAVGPQYQWLLNGSPIAGATSQTENFTAPPGTYQCQVTDANGCIRLSPPITLTPGSTATATLAVQDSVFCEGQAGGATFVASPHPPGTIFNWFYNGNPLAVPNTVWNYNAGNQVATSGAYQVVIIDPFGCSHTSNTINITVNPNPVITLNTNGSVYLCGGASQTITATSSLSPVTYQWTINGAFFSNNQTITATSPGSYQITVASTTSGCFTQNSFNVVTGPDSVCDDCLVPNGDFEFFSNAPSSSGNLIDAPMWNQPTSGSPDYFNVAATNTIVGVPTNQFGSANAHSGSGYGGFLSLSNSEFLQTKLNCSLIPGQNYNISFWYRIASGSPVGFNNIGLALTANQILGTPAILATTPQLNLNTIQVNTTTWQQATLTNYSGNNEQYITIGNFSPSTTQTVTLSGMVVPYVYIDDVSVTPAPAAIAITGGNDTICAGQSVTLTASGCANYLWSTGSTSNTIVVTPSVTTTYSVTTTTCSQCPPVSGTIQVVVIPAPVVNAGADASFCAPTAVTLNASVLNTTTYSWTPASGLSCTTCLTPVATPTATTVYTLTATNSCGVASDQVTVFNGCLCPALDTISNLTGDSTINYPATITGLTSLAINGNLTVNTPLFTIMNIPDVLITANTKITVLAGCTLRIVRSSLYTCSTNMWDGIEVMPGAYLELDKSRIEDAKTAVYANGIIGGLRLYQTTFNRNYIALSIAAYNTGTPYPISIQRCVFDCQPWTTVPSQNIPTLDGPYPGQVSLYGIELNSVKDITIGDPSAMNLSNRFSLLRIGIRAQGSEYKVYNNKFLNGYANLCIPFPGNPCPVTGWAIWATKSKSVVGGYATYQPNSFSFYQNGIWSDFGYHLDALNNTFTTMHVGMFGGGICVKSTGFQTGQLVTINDNKMTDINHGIWYQNATNTTFNALRNIIKDFTGYGVYAKAINKGIVNINKNDLRQLNIPFYLGNTGIYVANVSATVLSSPVLHVDTNIIKNVDNGINVISIVRPFVWGNDIRYTNAVAPSSLQPYYGIRMQTNSGDRLFGNLVYGPTAPTSGTENYFYGISIEGNISGGVVTQSNVKFLGTGLRFRGYYNNSTTISCNVMTRNFSGLTLDTVLVGDQGNPSTPSVPTGIALDNQWSNPNQVSGSISVRGLLMANLVKPIFYTRSASLPWCPMATGIAPLQTIITASNNPFIQPVPNAAANCPNINYCPAPCNLKQYVKIAKNQSPFQTLDGTSKFSAQQDVLRTILIDSTLLDTTSIDGLDLTNFRDTMLANNNIGYLEDVNVKYSSGDTTAAKSRNQTIIPKGCADSYQKIVNEILLKTWARGIFEFESSDSTVLKNIAVLDPVLCGRAVYDARVMIDLNINDFSVPESASRVTATSESVVRGKLYPNPAKTEVYYELELADEENGFFVLYNITGEKVYSQKLISGQNKLIIDVANYANGLYLYRVIVNGENIESRKLEIQR